MSPEGGGSLWIRPGVNPHGGRSPSQKQRAAPSSSSHCSAQPRPQHRRCPKHSSRNSSQTAEGCSFFKFFFGTIPLQMLGTPECFLMGFSLEGGREEQKQQQFCSFFSRGGRGVFQAGSSEQSLASPLT